MLRQDLERLNREQLIAEAERIGVPRPRVLTQPELIDELIARTTQGTRERAKARGWLGRARDLLARVVERGLHLPEAARVLRSPGGDKSWPPPPPPLPTVTLAEIYAAQGHLERAIAVLDEVVSREPDHRDAVSLRERFADQLQRSRSRAGRSGPIDAAAPRIEQSEEPSDEEESSQPISLASSQAAASNDESVAMADTLPAAKLGAAQAALESADEVVRQEQAPAAAEEPSLPDRYNVDEIVAIAVDPRTLYLYWEVRATTLAHARALHPEGWLCVRVASVTASWEGPAVTTHDVRVDALYGDRFIQGIQPGSNVRVSIGWHTDEAFEPFAVGVDVTAPRAVPVETVSQDRARWQPAPTAQRATAARLERTRSARIAAGLPARSWAGAPVPRVERAPGVAPAATLGGGVGAPVDTGVEQWDPTATGDDVETPWFEPGGASELGRRGPGRRRIGVGGASELARGGASDLGRG